MNKIELTMDTLTLVLDELTPAERERFVEAFCKIERAKQLERSNVEQYRAQGDGISGECNHRDGDVFTVLSKLTFE